MKEREVAYNLLKQIVLEGQFSNIALRSERNVTPLVTQLVYGTLRNYRLVRYVWNKYATGRTANQLAVLLDMAVYELLFTAKPAYATINEIVEIAKKIKKGAYSSLVNAILHKVSKADLQVDDLAIATSHPDWLVRMWQAHYGKEVAEQICLEDLSEPRLALRVNTMKTSSEQLLKDSHFQKGQVESCLYYEGNILESEAYKNDLVIIQSESSQQVVSQLDLKEGMRVLDLCAAPGTKSLQMAMAMQDRGTVISNDLYDFRVELIRKNAERYGLKSIETVCHDGTTISEIYPQQSFDAVLLDGACSGLGTLKHKPEIKQNVKPEDIDDLLDLQKRLLHEAAKMVRKDGILLYSTCTLNRKENEKQIENFLNEHADYQLISQRTIMPMEYHSDGFYWAKLKRN